MKKLFTILVLILTVKSYGQNYTIKCDTVITCDTTYTDSLKAVTSVFSGSSTYFLWSGLESTVFGIPIIKRAWGGYGIMDIYYRVDTAISAKHPEQISIYVGDNDFDRTDLTDSAIYARYVLLVNKVVNQNPNALSLFLSVKPNPTKPSYTPRIVAFNNKLKLYLEGKPSTRFVDFYALMLKPDGTIDLTLYLPQPNVHPSSFGYLKLRDELKKFMIKN